MTDTKGCYAHGTLPGLAQLFKEVNSVTDIQKEIKEAIDKATGRGEWNVGAASPNGLQNVGYRGLMICQVFEQVDANLIANAPTWLLHQQELIEQLKEEFTRQVDGHAYTAKLYSQQMQENKRLREALEWYANTENHEWHEDEDDPFTAPWTNILNDNGERARQVLSQLGEQKGTST